MNLDLLKKIAKLLFLSEITISNYGNKKNAMEIKKYSNEKV